MPSWNSPGLCLSPSDMLSLEELRQALDCPDLTDEQLADLRAALYGLANVFIDRYLAERKRRRPPRPR